MKVHRSLRVDAKLWEQAEARAKAEGFTSTNQYLIHVLRSDLEREMGLEQMEASLAASIGKVAARVTSLATMHQALFAVVWELAEMFMRSNPGQGVYDRKTEERIEQFKTKVAGQVRGHSFWKGVTNAKTEAAAVETAAQ